MVWEQVTIVGCGLIGTSFARALRQHGLCTRVLGWDTSSANLESARSLAVVDQVDDAFGTGAVSQSDLIYLAMPVGAIVDFVSGGWSCVKPGALVTDSGSTKQAIHDAVAAVRERKYAFVGGHPITGSHLTGPENGRADLFTGHPYILTTDSCKPESEAFEKLHRTIVACGANVSVMTSARHDRAMAWVSHLPQLLASALQFTANEALGSGLIAEVSGPGYRDMTRLAHSSWSVWQDICKSNAGNISAAIDAAILNLSQVRDDLNATAAGSGASLSRIAALFEDYDISND